MMMSASAMSAMIRAKKKKMQEDHSDAVKLSGIPMDAQDIDILKGKEYGERLSENEPMEREEEPTLEAAVSKDGSDAPHEEAAEDPHEINEDDAMKMKMAKHMKIKAMMMRMK